MYTQAELNKLAEIGGKNTHDPQVREAFDLLKKALSDIGEDLDEDYGPGNVNYVELIVGSHVGEMHGHEPSRQRSTLVKYGFKAGHAHEISREVAEGIADKLGCVYKIFTQHKEAIVLSSSENRALLFYSYDHKFFITEVTR